MFRTLGKVCHESLLVQRKILFTSSVSYSLDVILQTKFPKRLISEVNRYIWHTSIHGCTQWANTHSWRCLEVDALLQAGSSLHHCYPHSHSVGYKSVNQDTSIYHWRRWICTLKGKKETKSKICEKIDAYPSSVLKWQYFPSRCYNGGWVFGISTPKQIILSL